MQYFFAYHGPQNKHNFNVNEGYGVSKKYKHALVNVGDRVFIIQKLAGKTSRTYLCGEYEITDRSINIKSRYPYRFSLERVSQPDAFIELDTLALSEELPQINGDPRRNNFQRHFCVQGLSFHAPLEREVIDILSSIIGSYAGPQEPRPRREDGMRMVKIRMDQAVFRREVLDNWHGKCAVTGSSLAIEACHIISHASQGNPSIENGIALAADLHCLFDNGDLSFINNKVILSDRTRKEERYKGLHGQDLRAPKFPVKFSNS